MRVVSVRGGGIAACCCARLLRRVGLAVVTESVGRPTVPAVMLSETAQKLLGDVFARSDLFAGLHQIRQRVVLWGTPKPVELPHRAVVVSEQTILDRLRTDVPANAEAKQKAAEWTIFAARVPCESGFGPSDDHNFGSRIASVKRVSLQTEVASDVCWIESCSEGWLFLLPSGERNAWLLAVGGAPESMLERSRLVAGQIGDITESGGSFPSHPRIADPLASPGWLACGSAALAFDPLCGDGVAHAAREAILAAALIHASAGGADSQALTEHYVARLTAGFRRHLEVCREFYANGGSGEWWKRQISELDCGLEWTAERLRLSPGFRYRLNGFTLEAVV